MQVNNNFNNTALTTYQTKQETAIAMKLDPNRIAGDIENIKDFISSTLDGLEKVKIHFLL